MPLLSAVADLALGSVIGLTYVGRSVFACGEQIHVCSPPDSCVSLEHLRVQTTLCLLNLTLSRDNPTARPDRLECAFPRRAIPCF